MRSPKSCFSNQRRSPIQSLQLSLFSATFTIVRKVSRQDRSIQKARMMVVASEEQAQQLLSKTTSITVTGEKTTIGTAFVVLDIVVGIDGHVWKAIPRNAPSELIGSAAAGAVRTWLYQPRANQGESVPVAATVDVIVSVRP